MKKMNELKIYHCYDCVDWFPNDKHGGGTHCGELKKIVSEKEDAPIPDWCPRLKKNEN